MSATDHIRLLLATGLSTSEVARLAGVSPQTVCYHARKVGLRPAEKFNRRYDWDEVQRYYDEGHSVRECREHFGFANQTWNDAVRRGAVRARPHGMPLEELLVADTPRSRWNLKHRLLRAGLKENQCEECGLREWRGRPLSLALHHANGDRHDNRLQNLVLLCPNCHSQTENFAGRNRRVGRQEAA